jgi:hypothetical protein
VWRGRADEKRLREAAITTTSSIPIISILILLLGAPLAFRTVLLAAHAALLLVWAPSYALGFGSHGSASRYRVKRIFSSFSYVSSFQSWLRPQHYCAAFTKLLRSHECGV